MGLKGFLMGFHTIFSHKTCHIFRNQARSAFLFGEWGSNVKEIQNKGRNVISISFSLTWSPVFAPVGGRRDECVVVLVVDDGDLVVVGGRLDDGAGFGAAAVVVRRVEQVRRWKREANAIFRKSAACHFIFMRPRGRI